MYVSRKFNPHEWEYIERDGKFILTGYLGYSDKVVFPKGEEFTIGGDFGDFTWGQNYHRITDIDFSNLLLNRGDILPLPNVPLRSIKNTCPNCLNFDNAFRDSTAIEEVDFSEQLVSCSGAFENAQIKRGFDIKGDIVALVNTYENCKNMRTCGTIPKQTRELIGTFRCSGVLNGLDLSKSNVNVLASTYMECFDLLDTGEFNDNILIMSSTFYRCLNLSKVRKLPDKCRFMDNTFHLCKEIKVQPDLPKDLRTADFLFSGCSIMVAKELPQNLLSVKHMYENNVNLVRGADVPNNVIDCSYMYLGCPKLRRGVNIGHSVISTNFMYSECITLESAPDIPDNVKFASFMFLNCYRLKRAPKLGKLINTSHMFRNCKTLQTAPAIPETVENMAGMFDGCDLLQGDVIILSKRVRNAERAFTYSKYLRRIYLDFNSKTYEAFERAGLTEKQKLLNIELRPLEEVRHDETE